MRKLRMCCLLAIIPLLTACVNPFIVSCRNEGTNPEAEFKYTARQTAVACDRAQLYADEQLFTYNKEKKIWELNPNGLLTSDLEKVMQDQVKSLDVLLSYKNQENADWIDWFPGFRTGLEREEQIALEILRRLNFVKAYNEFTDAVGELPEKLKPKEIPYFFPNGRKFYSMRLLYPQMGRRLDAIPFTAEYLEVARREGTLRLVDEFEVVSKQEFAKKVPDLQDPNEFTWKKQARGWVVKSYKMVSDNEKPNDNTVHYIEIFRRNDAGNTEGLPAVRGFIASGGTKVSVFVIDYDREGERGYGTPDEVAKTFADLTTGNEVYDNTILREKLLTALYESPQANRKENPERRKPKTKEIYTAIVKMGDVQVDAWEKCSESCTVPFDYKTLTQNAELMLVPPKTPAEKQIEERDKLRQIGAFIREFKQDGKVVVREYWIPKKQYANRDIVHPAAALVDTYKLRRKGGQEELAGVDYFAERIKTIDYSYGGKWFRIVDEDGDGNFEKKKVIAIPAGAVTSSTGVPTPDVGSYSHTSQ